MSDSEYPNCIRELYESEILGEAMALALLDAAKTDRDYYHIATLLQLETETKARLRPLLCKYGLPLSEEMDTTQAATAAAAYAGSSFSEFAALMKPAIESFVARFREIELLGPPEDRKMLQSMVRHESAILRWIELESEGPSDESLDGIIAELHYPLPEPRGE